MVKKGVDKATFQHRRLVSGGNNYRWSDGAHLQIEDSDQLVEAGGHHHLPHDGHHGDSVTVALIDPHQLSCL